MFLSNAVVKYQDMQVVVKSVFRQPFQLRNAAIKALAAQSRLESDFQLGKLTDLNNPQRRDNKVKGNSIGVANTLAGIVSGNKVNIMYGTHTNLPGVVLEQENGISRPNFEAIYQANEELLSKQFTHVTTDNLNRLKQALIAILADFEQKVLSQPNSNFYKKLRQENKISACREVIAQTKNLIASAKTVSAVIASIAVEADVLAQMGLAEDAFLTDSAADVFKDKLPKALGEEVKGMTIGSNLNHVGSAFQLERARESLVTKLETYLNSRARLDGVDIKDTTKVNKTYSPIDRGFFYNKKLQQARIGVAAKLLTQLETMQLEDGTAIDNPQVFAKALMAAIEANDQCYKEHARGMIGGIGVIDGIGELALCLDAMRKEMGEIYPQNIKIGRVGANLREQLGLNEAKEPSMASRYN